MNTALAPGRVPMLRRTAADVTERLCTLFHALLKFSRKGRKTHLGQAQCPQTIEGDGDVQCGVRLDAPLRRRHQAFVDKPPHEPSGVTGVVYLQKQKPGTRKRCVAAENIALDIGKVEHYGTHSS